MESSSIVTTNNPESESSQPKKNIGFWEAPKLRWILLLYVAIIAVFYAPVVFFGYTLEPATYGSYGVTDNGVYEFVGRRPIQGILLKQRDFGRPNIKNVLNIFDALRTVARLFWNINIARYLL